MPKPQKIYTVTADYAHGQRIETRTLAASALCVANKWAEHGFVNIVVTDRHGRSFSHDEFRATLPLVRRMAKRRN